MWDSLRSGDAGVVTVVTELRPGVRNVSWLTTDTSARIGSFNLAIIVYSRVTLEYVCPKMFQDSLFLSGVVVRHFNTNQIQVLMILLTNDLVLSQSLSVIVDSLWFKVEGGALLECWGWGWWNTTVCSVVSPHLLPSQPPTQEAHNTTSHRIHRQLISVQNWRD